MSIEEEEGGSGIDPEEEGAFDVDAEEEDEEEDEGEQEEEDAAEQVATSWEASTGTYSALTVNDQVFEELHLPPGIAEDVQAVWRTFLSASESREAAGEAIYGALFDAAPSLQSLFKTPRAVMAMRLMNGFSSLVSALTDPKALKIVVETLGFQHLDLEVTIPRVIVFRDAIVDLLAVEMGARLSPKGRDGWNTFLNYVGGSFIFVRVKFAERLKLLTASWAVATKKGLDAVEAADEGEGEGEGAGEHAASGDAEAEFGAAKTKQASAKSSKKKGWGFGAKGGSGSGRGESGSGSGNGDGTDFQNTTVPTTYDEMFMFNAAVMGFGSRMWMNEVLASFDTIVSNVSNSYRLQEECDILALRMAKYKGAIALHEYKAVMLASLRSLVKDWGSQHEVSWSWLWENVERMIKALLGKPAVQERALAKFFVSLDEQSLGVIRRELFAKFFALAPAGQDFFKQSTTRLHFIADKFVPMTLDMYRDPKRMVQDLSALGLRHVGYGVPTDLCGPFVTACVQVIRSLTEDDTAEEAFRWSLSLISRILTRVINEGSTIVMKAINANSGKQLKKAVGCAPRGKRALWMLNIQVGTQSISPLMWALETGSLDAAKAILMDLLTIRADRDRYYYGMDILFERHPDVIKRLLVDAPALTSTLLDGLIWRSRTTESGQRRANYYIKHLIIDAHGGFAKNIAWLTESNDPEIVCHPIISLVTDMVWGRVAFRTFLYGNVWFLFTLVVFVLSQSVLNHLYEDPNASTVATASSSAGHRLLSSVSSVAAATAAAVTTSTAAPWPRDGRPLENRVSIFVCRCFIYLCSMGQWVFFHTKNSVRDLRNGSVVRVGCIRIPEYLCAWKGWASLLLTVFLALMMCLEPILHCARTAGGAIFTEHCPEGEHLLFPYSIMATGAMLLYFLLLSDLSVFSTRVSAFALVCCRVISEVFLFLVGLCFFVCAFACAVSALGQSDPDFAGIDKSAMQLFKITFGMFSGTHYDRLNDQPALMVSMFVYVITTVIFLLNLLIAQLNCAYASTYKDMLGFARLNRGKIVVETMPSVPKWRWGRFCFQLSLDERVEFGEGDMGLAGGLQVWELASANVTTVDMIRRFGGSTSPGAQWPEDEGTGADEEDDRFDRMERLIEKAMKRMAGKGGSSKGGSKIGSSMGTSGLSGSDDPESGSQVSG